MIQNNYFTENEDLILQFKEIIDWSEVVEEYENGFEDAKKYKETSDERLAYAPASLKDALEMYQATLEALGEIIGREVSSRAREMDHIGLKYSNGTVTFPEPMVECYRMVQEAGLQPYSIHRKYGGLGLPAVVQTMMMEILARGDAAFAIAVGCVNLAETIQRFGSEEMKNTWIPKMAAGKIVGAMALTEPNYGSDLPNVQTRAEKDEKGVWRINGTKRFITHGCGFTDSPSVILTLARTGSPTSGARGLSFFLVEGKDVHIASIEKKLGLHCSPTCEVVFENSAAELIGEESQGLVKYAMGMMNAARLSIASQSMGIGSAAYYEAKKYASERVQFGKPIQEITAVKKMLDRMEREIAAMRAVLLEAGKTVDMYAWRTERLEESGMKDRDIRKDEKIRKWEKLANFFTPLSKYYNSELCNSIAYDAIQIHGGAGYTEDYDVAKIYRDARITNIYEGTTQLQVVAAIGGVVAGMTPAGNLRSYIQEEMAKFTPSDDLRSVLSAFEEIVEKYRNIENSEIRDGLAFEVVESSARFLNGMLLERGVAKLTGEKKAHRLKLIADYHIDSLSICQANLMKLNLKSRTAAGVA